MNLEILNPHVMKIVISARDKDSIRSIAKRIGLSYGWTYYWTQQLISSGLFKRKNNRIFLDKTNRLYKELIGFVKRNFKNDISFRYYALGLFGIKYSFTKTDAVFIWTKGGYNISRYKEFYPIFIKVRKIDLELFASYCKKLGFKINSNRHVFFSVDILEDFKVYNLNGMPVDSLEETIKFMKDNIYNFEPALEMIQEMYNKKLKIRYKEIKTNV